MKGGTEIALRSDSHRLSVLDSTATWPDSQSTPLRVQSSPSLCELVELVSRSRPDSTTCLLGRMHRSRGNDGDKFQFGSGRVPRRPLLERDGPLDEEDYQPTGASALCRPLGTYFGDWTSTTLLALSAITRALAVAEMENTSRRSNSTVASWAAYARRAGERGRVSKTSYRPPSSGAKRRVPSSLIARAALS